MTTNLRFLTTSHQVPKSKGTAAECEDQYSCDLRRGFFAIADGASQSAFPRSWAELLVKSFVQDPRIVLKKQWDTWLPPLQKRWSDAVATMDLPWFLETKVVEGAYAAFLGLRFGTDFRWHAVAVGDCCVFHIRGDDLLAAFPLDHPDQFTNSPALIGSREPTESLLAPNIVKTIRGEWQYDDDFLLTTDALASYFLQQQANGVKAREVLDAWLALSEDEFRQQVQSLRREYFHDDDVTFLHITPRLVPVHASAAPHLQQKE